MALERLRQALFERLHPEIKTGSLEDFMTTARLSNANRVIAIIGERAILVQPEMQEVVPPGHDRLEFYTEFRALGAGNRTVVFTTTNDIATLARTREVKTGSMIVNKILYDQAQVPYRISLLRTDEIKRRLIAQGFKVAVQRRSVVYSDEEFARMVRGIHLIGSFTG